MSTLDGFRPVLAGYELHSCWSNRHWISNQEKDVMQLQTVKFRVEFVHICFVCLSPIESLKLQ